MRTSVIAHGDSAPVFDTSEHIFDFMAFSIEFCVMIDGFDTVLFGWDARFDPTLFQSLSEPVRIIASVSDHDRSVRELVEYEGGPDKVASVTLGQKHDNGATLAVANGMKFRVQAPLCAADTSGKSPFLSRLAAVRWALR